MSLSLSEIKANLACLSHPTQQELLGWIGRLLSKIEENTDELEINAETVNLNTEDLEEKLTLLGNQNLPPYDYMSATFYGATNNYQVLTYREGGSGGTVVATITLTYLNGAAANDDTIATYTKVIP